MSFRPLVSIVTPSFNQARYLETTLRSVLGQDYPHIEYLVVDGGSSDGSVAIIRRYAQRLAWWVSEPDRGQADGINKGLRRARGEIVAWLNSDDVYAPWAVREAVEAFRRHPQAGLVYGNALSIDAAGRAFHTLKAGPWGLPQLMTFHMLAQPAVFMRRDVAEAVGFLDDDFHFLLDHKLWLKMAARAEMVYVPRVWAFARYHSDAKNAAQAERFGEEALRLARWLATDAAFAPLYARLHRRVWAAAYRFRGRYLMDADRYAAALGSYLHGLWLHPPTVLPEAHRLAFALVGSLGLGAPLRRWYYRRAWGKVPPEAVAIGIVNADAFWQQAAV